MAFQNLTTTLQQNLANRLNWTFFRPAQEKIVKAVPGGRNLWFMGPLGAGKTTGLGVALTQAILQNPGQGVRALYLGHSAVKLSEVVAPNELGVVVWHESTPAEQKRCLSDPPEVLAASPGELQKLVGIRELWAHLDYLVVDDVDFLDAAEVSALSYLIEEARAGRDPQRIALSTTVGNPEECLAWLSGSSQRPGEVVPLPSAGGTRILEVEHLPPLADRDQILTVKVRGRRSLLRTQNSSQSAELRSALEGRGLRCQGETRDCLVTSRSEIGEDSFQQLVDLCPASSVSGLLGTMALAQRTPGRVSRITLAQEDDIDFLAACALLRLAGQRWVEPKELSQCDWLVYLSQVLERILTDMGIRRERALTLGKDSFSFRELSEQQRSSVLDFNLERGYFQQVDRRIVLGTAAEKLFDHAGWHFLTKPQELPAEFEVQGSPGPRRLAAWFVTAFPTLGFEMNGVLGELRNARHRDGVADWRELGSAPELVWSGSPCLYHPRVAQEIHAVLTSVEALPFLQPRQVRHLEQLRQKWRSVLGQRPVSFSPDRPRTLHTFAGGRVNGLLARWHQLKTGESVRFNNLVLQVDGESLATSLKSFLSAPESELADLTRDLARGPLHQLLPPSISAQYLRSRLFDEAGAREVARTALELFETTTERPVAETVEPTQKKAEVSGDPFLAQLHTLITEHPTRTKWVLVPERNLGWMLGERLLLEGTNWVDLRFVTPFELALDVAAPHLLTDDINPRPEGLGPDFVTQLLNKLPSQVPSYFRSLAGRPRVGQCLWKALQELRMAGLAAADTDRGCFQPEEKGRELKALLKSYEEHLQTHRLGDRASVFRKALEHLEDLPMVPGDLVVGYPSHCWHPLEKKFLDALPGERVESWVHQVVSVPRRWELLCPSRQVVTSTVDRDVHLLREPNSDYKATFDGSLQFFCAGRRDAEVQEVFRRLLDGPTPLDHAELVVPDQECLHLVWDKLCKYGIPATFEDGLPATLTTPGKALLGLLQWCESGFSAFYLRELLLAGLLQPDDEMSPSEGARFLERSRVSWGRETYAHQLTQLKERYLLSAQHEELEPEQVTARNEAAEKVGRFSDWVGGLLEKLPASSDAPCDISEFSNHLLSILEQNIPVRTALDGTALSALQRVLKEMGQAGGVQDGFALVRERLEELRLAASRPDGWQLHITSPLKLGRSGRTHVFILGLEAGTLAPDLAQDPVLSDRERESLHPGLQRSTDRLEEYQAKLFTQLAAVQGSVTMSYSCRDYKTGEELLCSRFFFDSVRMLHPEVHEYEQLFAVLGEPIAFAPASPDKAAGETEWWLTCLRGKGPESKPVVVEGFPWLHRGEQAGQARQGLLFTAFDGWVPQAAHLFDPRKNQKPISVSRLQSTAACPHRAFLETVLKLSPLELELPNLDQWLDARLRGTALHETFAAYYRALRDLARRPQATDKELLRRLLELELDLIRKATPPPSEAVERRDVQRLERDLDKFLTLECASSREVVSCELGFGLDDPHGEPFATLDPVQVELTEGFQFHLRGRIDRLDRVGKNEYEVVDYKSGRSLYVDARARYSQGRLLQHALYALVAEKLLRSQVPDAQIRGSSYYFPVLKAEKDWVPFPYPDRVSLAEVVGLVLEPLATGAFCHTKEKEEVCRFCDFRAACDVHQDSFVRGKLENDQNEMLQSRLRLEEIT